MLVWGTNNYSYLPHFQAPALYIHNKYYDTIYTGLLLISVRSIQTYFSKLLKLSFNIDYMCTCIFGLSIYFSNLLKLILFI